MSEITLEKAIEIFNKYGIKTRMNGDDLIISHYCQPKEKTFKELGIDENELIKNVVGCEGTFDTRKSALTTFPLVVSKEIRLYDDIIITEMPNLKAAGVIMTNKHLKKLPKLKAVGSVSFEESPIKSLPKLKQAGILIAQNSALKELPCLETVFKLCIVDCPIEDIKKLETGDDIFICSSDETNKTPVSILNLEEVKNLFVANSKLKSLPKLKKAEKLAFYNCEIKSIKSSIKANVEIEKQITDEGLSDKFDNFTDWYNSEVFEKSMSILGDVINQIQS